VLLVRGNAKLGKHILAFSIPALHTCPGASDGCKLVCYAMNGHFRHGTVKDAHTRNLDATKTNHFVSDVVNEIRTRKTEVVRIHVAGDFYSAAYCRKWLSIVQQCPNVQFFAYTRSWTIPGILPTLIEFGHQPNVVLFWSHDKTMPKPPKVRGIRTAYMSLDDSDVPKYVADLVFRDKTDTPLKTMGRYESTICPVEQGIERKIPMTCENCRICFTAYGRRSSREQTAAHT